MRIFLLAAAALLIAAPASAETRNFGVSGFTKIRLKAPVRVHLATGVAPFARGTGSSAALQNISIRVESGVLTIGTNQSSWGGYPGKNAGPAEVFIGTHEIESVSLTGAGTIDIDRVKGLDFLLTVQGAGDARIAQVEVDQLTLGVAGTGMISVAGRAKMLDAAIRGSSALEAGSLTVKDMKLVVDGAGSAAATVTNSVKVAGAGSGEIAFAGNPSCQLKLTGTGNITGCR